MIPKKISRVIFNLSENEKKELTEIRLRLGKKVQLKTGQRQLFSKTDEVVSKEDIEYLLSAMSDHSLNSIKNEVARGYVPLLYGCRAGIAGECIFRNGELEFQKNINSVNIRIAREIVGCSEPLMKEIYSGDRILSTLIVSRPGCGKTTLLRDIGRSLAECFNVCIIDERNEITSVCNGLPQFDCGKRSDIFFSCLKAKGIPLAVRNLSPDVIITDEIARKEDCLALTDAERCGVRFIATLHADSVEEAVSREISNPLFTSGALDKVILLTDKPRVGTVVEIRSVK